MTPPVSPPTPEQEQETPRPEPADAPPPKTPRRWDPPTVLALSAALILFLAVSWQTLLFWYGQYMLPEGYYAHAPLIPLIVGLLAWHRRDAIRAAEIKPAPAALAVLLPSLALLVFASKMSADAVMSMAFLLVLWSGVWAAFGTAFVKAAAFPLFFIALMSPLPGPLLNESTHGLQQVSTVFANKLLGLAFQTSLQGNIIAMDNFQLFVDVPCSGFKMLLAMVTFNAAFCALLDGRPARRWGLFLFSLPLSLAMNATRIALIGVVGECISGQAAHVFHDWSGMLTLVLGFVVLFSIAKGLGCRTFAGWPIF